MPVDVDRIRTLPKWAQARIELLTKNLEFEQRKIRQMSTGDTPITWEMSGTREQWHGIPARATLRIQVTTGVLELQLRHGVLQVRNFDTGRIMTQPSSHNSLEISIEPREADDAAMLMRILRKMEVEERYQDMEDSGIMKCFRCDVPVGDGHGHNCPYYPLPPIQS